MKCRLLLFVLAIALPGVPACSTATVGLMNRAAKPDQAVVESFVRFNDEAGAREYLIRFGLPEHDVMGRLQLAREAVKRAAEKAAKEK